MREWMNVKFCQTAGWGKLILAACLAVVALLCVPLARAQQEDEEQKGVDSGNYNVKQSVEFGGRFTNFTGNQNTYKTLVNLQDGPRLLNFTAEMRSLNHHGSLFDRLYFTNFGYGGDPNNVSRLRINKNKWYDFNAQFRRDVNFWDYSLLANPLNPIAPAFANAPAGFTPIIGISPHLFNVRRRLSDYDVTLLPQSRVRFRLGYSRNVTAGPAFSSVHYGTEALLLEDTSNTVNSYHFGVDFKLLPRTNISYDQFFSYYKGDTGISDQNRLFSVVTAAGPTVPVDIGVSLNAGANQPCSATFLGAPNPPGTIKPTCSGYFAYGQHGRARTNSPTEQISMQSNYFRKLDLSGRFSYTGGDMLVSSWDSAFAGLESRTNLRNGDTFGPVSGRHVNTTADFGVTWHVTGNFSVLDSFHFANFRNPAVFNGSLCDFFATSMANLATAFTSVATLPVQCTVPAGVTPGITPPTHSTSSAPDVAIFTSALFLKQEEETNLFSLEYRVNSRLGARAGYRYRSRTIARSDVESGTFVFFPTNQNARALPRPFNTLTCPAANNLADGTCVITPPPDISTDSTDIHENSGLVGIWARPVPEWRISFDTEFMKADNTFTRISPRQFTEYRVRSTYQPSAKISVSGSMDLVENSNNVPEINNLQHSRLYGLAAIYEPNAKFSIEAGYDYSNIFSQILICYTSSTAPAGLSKCPGQTVLVEQLSTYTNRSHFEYADVMYKPLKRLTMRLGASFTGTKGTALAAVLTPNAPPGTLNSNYYKPYGGFDFRIWKGVTWKTYWNYFGYHEDQSLAIQDQFARRNFRGNMATLSLRYAF
jgi:hypothetical protein